MNWRYRVASDLPQCDNEFERNPDQQTVTFLTKNVAEFQEFLARVLADGWAGGKIYGWNQQ